VMHFAHELSTIGRCATFDETADGFARGEGCGALWVKPASKQAETSRIMASIRGLDAQHAGRSVSLTSPSGKAQRAVLMSSLRHSRLSEHEIDLVECHGTGTALGDAIEVGALLDLICHPKRTAPLLLGTIKTNVSHTESSSGSVGLIKCILHLRHSCVPANQHLRQLNKHGDRGATTTDCFKPQFPIEPLSVKRRESSISGIVSAFGLGGCNATVVFQTTGSETKPRTRDPQSPTFYVETWVGA